MRATKLDVVMQQCRQHIAASGGVLSGEKSITQVLEAVRGVCDHVLVRAVVVHERHDEGANRSED